MRFDILKDLLLQLDPKSYLILELFCFFTIVLLKIVQL